MMAPHTAATEDNGFPTMMLYGVGITIRMQKHTPDTSRLLRLFEDVMGNVCRGAAQICEKISGGEWAIIGSIWKQGEQPGMPVRHRARLEQADNMMRRAPFNEAILLACLKIQNVDKRSDRSIRHFNPERIRVASCWAEVG
jgi:hypothetical protein